MPGHLFDALGNVIVEAFKPAISEDKRRKGKQNNPPTPTNINTDAYPADDQHHNYDENWNNRHYNNNYDENWNTQHYSNNNYDENWNTRTNNGDDFYAYVPPQQIPSYQCIPPPVICYAPPPPPTWYPPPPPAWNPPPPPAWNYY